MHRGRGLITRRHEISFDARATFLVAYNWPIGALFYAHLDSTELHLFEGDITRRGPEHLLHVLYLAHSEVEDFNQEELLDYFAGL